MAAQVIWQAKQTKFGFIQVYSSAPHLLFLTENRALRGGHLHDSVDFFSIHIRRFRDSRGGRPLTLERMAVGSNTLCSGPFVASPFFFFFFFLTRLSQTALLFRWSLDITRSTRSTTELLVRSGLRRPVSSSDRCWVWLSKRLTRFLASPQLVFSLRRHRYLDAQVQNTNFVTWLSRQAHDREICLNPAVAILRRTSHCAETARFLPPFFWRYTTPPCSAHRTDLCFSTCRFSQVVFIPRTQPHAQSLFLFPIVFGINFIHFFDEKKNGAAGNSIVFFRCFDPLSRHWTEAKRRIGPVSKSATFLATESVNSAPFKREKLRCKFLARESAIFFANTKVQIFG